MPTADKLKAGFCALVILTVVIATLCILVPHFFTNLNRIITHHPYIAFNAWDLPFFVGIPMFGCLLWGIVLRLTNTATEARIKLVIKCALIFAIAAAVTRVIYGFAGAHYLKQEGYTRCWTLSAPSMMAPNVWVADNAACLDNAAAVRKPLLLWIDQQILNGEELSIENLKRQTDILLSEQNKKNGEI